jgi:hypothetical protein
MDSNAMKQFVSIARSEKVNLRDLMSSTKQKAISATKELAAWYAGKKYPNASEFAIKYGGLISSLVFKDEDISDLKKKLKEPLAKLDPAIIEKMYGIIDDIDISGCGGCGTSDACTEKADFVKAASRILGEPLPVDDKRGEFPEEKLPLSVVVPLSNHNSHNYKIGQPILVINYDRICMRADGTTGNHVGTEKSDLRPASEKEIDSFFASITTDVEVTIIPRFDVI